MGVVAPKASIGYGKIGLIKRFKFFVVTRLFFNSIPQGLQIEPKQDGQLRGIQLRIAKRSAKARMRLRRLTLLRHPLIPQRGRAGAWRGGRIR